MTPRQNHYGNVCALRRQRSSVSNRSAECLLAASVLQRRAASVDFPDSRDSSNKKGVINRTLSQPTVRERNIKKDGLVPSSSPHYSDNGEVFSFSPIRSKISEEFNSPDEESPSKSAPRIKDLREFKKLTSKIKATKTDENEAVNSNSVDKSVTLEISKGTSAKRCFSDSDADAAANLEVTSLDEGDVDVWQNPISPSDSDDSEKLEIIAQEERPSEIEVNRQKSTSPDMNNSLNSCEEAQETDWQVSMSGDLVSPPPSLPPPDEFGGGNPFLMFLCVTLLTQHRQFIMQHNMDHNELAMHFDKMVRKHNVHKVLYQARKMFENYLNFCSKISSSKVTSPCSATSVDQSC